MRKILCLLILLSPCAMVDAESKTEVVVKKGIVKTTTAEGDALISPGQKAVLEDGKAPAVSITNKLVEKLLGMHKQLQAQRAKSSEKIDYTLITSLYIEQENEWKTGAVMTFSNQSDKPETVVRIGPTSPPVEGLSFFTLDGAPLQYEKEKIDSGHDYYYLHFDKPVEPKKDFETLMIKDMNASMPWFEALKKEVLTQSNGQWRLHMQNDTPCSLNYMQFVLPRSAIFVKSDPPAYTIEQQDGRVSVTLRKYVGTDAYGPFNVYFLWPEKDGTCLKGIPWDNAGPEAVKIYDLFIRENIQSPELWGELGIKLIGGQFYQQAYDAFQRCRNGKPSAVWDYTALTWQGHILDLRQEREKAVEKYQQALAIKPQNDMRHDQWGITLTQKWIQDRRQKPFTEELKQNYTDFTQRLNAIEWTNAKSEALQLYKDTVADGIVDESKGWTLLGLKLVGSGWMDEAMDCFIRCEKIATEGRYLFISRVWQGHLLDLKQQRTQAIEKYRQALAMDDKAAGTRHDQWGIILTKDWVKERIKTPFASAMLKK